MQILPLHSTNNELHLGSKVTDEMHLPSKGPSVAMDEGDSRKCEALQSQISCLIKVCLSANDCTFTVTSFYAV